MTAVFAGSQFTESAGAAIVNPGLPAGTSNGETLLALALLDINTTSMTSVPSGWVLEEGPIAGSQGDERIYVYSKVTSGTESGTWTPSVTTRGWGILIMRFTGAHATTPVNAHANLANAPTATPAVPRPTSTVDDCLAVAMGSSDQSAVTPPWYTPPTGWAEQVDAEVVGTNQPFGVWTITHATAGQLPAATWTQTASDSSAAVTVLIAPAAGGGPTPFEGWGVPI